MAVEFIEILKGKALLKSNTSIAKEITEAGVKESAITSTLNALRGIGGAQSKQVLQQSKTDAKIWVLTIKYGVSPVSMAKITANTKDEAVADAIKYVEGLKTKTSEAIAGQFRAAVESKKKALAKAKKTRDEEQAKIDKMSADEKIAYQAAKKAKSKSKKKKAA